MPRVIGTFALHEGQKSTSEQSAGDRTLPFAHTACRIMAQVPVALRGHVRVPPSTWRLLCSETSMTSHGMVVCSNSHGYLGHSDGRERPPTAQSIELRPFRDRSDCQTARGRAHPTQPPLTRPLTRPYRPVQLRCSQLSTVSKCCAPANLTHCRGRDSGGILTVCVYEH